MSSGAYVAWLIRVAEFVAASEFGVAARASDGSGEGEADRWRDAEHLVVHRPF